MKEEVLRVLNKCEEMKWITINEKLDRGALAGVFVELLKDMPLSKFVEMMNIFDY